MESSNETCSEDHGQETIFVNSEKRLNSLIAKISQDSVDVNILDELGQTALMLAAGRGSEEIIRTLLIFKPDINYKDNDGRTALHYARAAEVSRLLLSNGAAIGATDNQLITPIHWCSMTQNEMVLSVLIEQKADVGARDRYGKTALHYAANVARVLLSNGAHIHAEDQAELSPIHCCSITSNGEVMSVLMSIVVI